MWEKKAPSNFFSDQKDRKLWKIVWYFAATRVTGTSHQRNGLSCQDQFECKCIGDVFIAALGDGAGSAKYGGKGAKTATKKAVSYITKALRSEKSDFEKLLKEAILTAKDSISTLAEQENQSIKSFATTLLVVVITDQGGAAVQVGDGVIIIREREEYQNTWRNVFWPQHGEYVNTTNFLTQTSKENISSLLQSTKLNASITDIALMSDGLESFVLDYKKKAVHPPALEALFKPLHNINKTREGKILQLSKNLKTFLKTSERICSGTDDDLSLILATRTTLNLAETQC